MGSWGGKLGLENNMRQVLHPDSVPTLTLPAPQSLPGLLHQWESLLSTLDNLLPKFPCKCSLPFVIIVTTHIITFTCLIFYRLILLLSLN